MNLSEIFNSNLFKNEFKKSYTKQKYNFEIDSNFFSNIIIKLKLKTNNLKKINSLDVRKNYQNRLILREYKNLYKQIEKKKE